MTLWSDAASERLVELHREGRSASVIADFLHREGLISVTRNAIIGRAHRLKLPKRYSRQPQQLKPRKTKQEKQARQTELRRLKRAALRKAKPMMDEATRERLRCEPVASLHISIYDLTDATCRFPYGDRPPLTYCGLPPTVGSPYCAHHEALCGAHPRWPR